MSCTEYIVQYAGASIRFSDGIALAESEDTATRFACEADAWQAIFRYRLTSKYCKVVSLSTQTATKN